MEYNRKEPENTKNLLLKTLNFVDSLDDAYDVLKMDHELMDFIAKWAKTNTPPITHVMILFAAGIGILQLDIMSDDEKLSLIVANLNLLKEELLKLKK